MMHSFTDSKDKQWSLDFEGDALRRVKKLLAVDLTELEGGDPPLAYRLERDTVFMVDVLYVLLKPQADADNISDEDFGRRLGPSGLKDAREALGRELVDFFRQLGRPEQAEVVLTQLTFLKAATTRSLSRLERIDIDALLNEAERQADEKLKIPLKPVASGSSSTT